MLFSDTSLCTIGGEQSWCKQESAWANPRTIFTIGVVNLIGLEVAAGLQLEWCTTNKQYTSSSWELSSEIREGGGVL